MKRRPLPSDTSIPAIDGNEQTGERQRGRADRSGNRLGVLTRPQNLCGSAASPPATNRTRGPQDTVNIANLHCSWARVRWLAGPLASIDGRARVDPERAAP